MSRFNKLKKLSNFQSSILRSSKLLVLLNQKECCYTVLPELEKPFLQEQLHITLIVNSLEFQEQSSFKSISERVQEWSENCSSWLESMPPQSFSWMRSTLLEVLVRAGNEATLKYKEQCLSYLTNLMDSKLVTTSKSLWQQTELIFLTQLYSDLEESTEKLSSHSQMKMQELIS